MSFDTLIRGAKVVAPETAETTDIGISGGRVAAIGTALGPADKVISADGLIALPGGIDSHVHVSQPAGRGLIWQIILTAPPARQCLEEIQRSCRSACPKATRPCGGRSRTITLWRVAPVASMSAFI